VTARDLVETRFRASRDHELVLHDRLSAAERVAFEPRGDDPGYYGVLRPRPGSGYGFKQVGPDTALLFLTLADPGPIPSYVRASLGDAWSRTVTQLVLDGVLEAEVEGRFVSGAEAYAALCGPLPSPPAFGALGRLSRDALLHAQELAARMPAMEAATLAGRLYAYNQLPLSPAWRRRLPDRASVRRFLGLEGDRKIAAALAAPWQEAEWGSSGWIAWHARGFQGFGGAHASRCWKLYLSPRPGELPPVFARTVGRLHDLRAVSFKVGADAPGILRSDKMVMYFLEKQHMLDAGRELNELLGGTPAQGVPFTADIEGGNGLVSWGVDRFPASDQPSWVPSESWRVRITHRLAVALVAAMRGMPAPEEPWRFALGRIDLEGVDPATWVARDGDEPASEGGSA
jgi:hypothetical protein